MLRRFPLDAVTIDSSFIEDVAVGTRQAALVHAIVELCRILELDTVAEGVETNEQAIRLTQLGCRLAQGFYFGRPMRSDDLARRLKAGSTLGVGRRVGRSHDPGWASAHRPLGEGRRVPMGPIGIEATR